MKIIELTGTTIIHISKGQMEDMVTETGGGLGEVGKVSKEWTVKIEMMGVEGVVNGDMLPSF